VRARTGFLTLAFPFTLTLTLTLTLGVTVPGKLRFLLHLPIPLAVLLRGARGGSTLCLGFCAHLITGLGGFCGHRTRNRKGACSDDKCAPEGSLQHVWFSLTNTLDIPNLDISNLLVSTDFHLVPALCQSTPSAILACLMAPA
jgi:hypothetical protein